MFANINNQGNFETEAKKMENFIGATILLIMKI